jgi:DNA mismatch endonuclease (patch repair protein)
MSDVLTPDQRRFNMSRIKGSDTGPEKLLRSGLHARGLRFRLHRRDLPGCPDIVFPASRIAVFVDGCFWHGCPLHGARPKSNRTFWRKKLSRNKKRDKEVTALLEAQGWTVMRYWEHEIKRDIPGVICSVLRVVTGSRGPKRT